MVAGPIAVAVSYVIHPLGSVNHTDCYNSEFRFDFYADVPVGVSVDQVRYKGYATPRRWAHSGDLHRR